MFFFLFCYFFFVFYGEKKNHTQKISIWLVQNTIISNIYIYIYVETEVAKQTTGKSRFFQMVGRDIDSQIEKERK